MYTARVKQRGILSQRDSAPAIPFPRFNALRNIHLLKDVTLYRSFNFCHSAMLLVAENI